MATTETGVASTDLVSRLKRAEGQLRGVQRMMDEGAETKDVLAQLAAVKAAVDRVGLHLVSQQLRSCVESEEESCAEAFEDAMATFLRYTTLAR